MKKSLKAQKCFKCDGEGCDICHDGIVAVREEGDLNDSWFPEDRMDKKFEYEAEKFDNKRSDCMHDNCEGCKNGTCSGVHMISCPCKKCSPWS